MLEAGQTGSVVTLICDSGVRYAHTYYDDGWVAAQGMDLAPHRARMDGFLATGIWR
jgi:cysteine synthase A